MPRHKALYVVTICFIINAASSDDTTTSTTLPATTSSSYETTDATTPTTPTGTYFVKLDVTSARDFCCGKCKESQLIATTIFPKIEPVTEVKLLHCTTSTQCFYYINHNQKLQKDSFLVSFTTWLLYCCKNVFVVEKSQQMIFRVTQWHTI